ncbi:MAG: translation initiation factor IF-5A [Candidatus Micrarchaeia archaeon]
MSDFEIKFASAKDLKKGSYVMIDDIPCKVVEIDTSSPGKHGAAKMRITAIGVFTNQKKSLIKPSDGEVEVPIISKKRMQVVSVSETSMQIMDSETYAIYDIPIPEDYKGKIHAGVEIEVLEAGGQHSFSRVLSQE